jgi:hypothetical protein
MSLSSQFENEISSYADQLSAYKDQVNEYKNQLLEAKGEADDFKKSLITEVGVPIAVELARIGATKLLGSSAGNLVSKLAGVGLQKAAGADGSLAENLANTARQAMSGVEPAAEESGSALNLAKNGVMSVINRVRGGGQEAVAKAEDAIEGAQEGLTSAASSLAESVATRATSAVGDLIQSQVTRLNGLSSDNDIISSLKSAYSSIRAPEDTSMYGDVELTNFASAVPRAGVADLSLPFESAFSAPLSKFSLDSVPDAFSGISDLATMGASKFVSSFTEPLAQSGLSSNVIARAFMNRPSNASIEIPDSVIPSQEEALSILSQQVRPLITSDLLPQGAGDIEGAIGTVTEGAGEALSGALGTVAEGVAGILGTGAVEALSGISSALSGAAGSATSILGSLSGAIDGAASAAKTAGTLAETAGEAAGEAGTEIAAGAEGGPVGLVLGLAVGVGTFIYDIFHHHTTTVAPPPALAPMSIPSFQPGLATGN